MSSIVGRKTSFATLVVENFSQMTLWNHVYFKINDSTTFFGIQPKTTVYNDEYVSIYLMNFQKSFKFRANVHILNLQSEKIFTKEIIGEFGGGFTRNLFSLLPRSVLSQQYLFSDKLTLLCELEVVEDGRDNQKTIDAIQIDLNNLSENFQSLLTEAKFTDATLVVGKDGKEFQVHKTILVARSPVFAAMFEHDCEEKRQNKVNITDMDEEVCAEMLSYIYTGKVKELDRFAMELLVVADKYQLHSLKSICCQYMCDHLSVDSVANVLVLADLHQAAELKSKCFAYICANVEQVQTTDGWKVLEANLLKELFIYLAMKK